MSNLHKRGTITCLIDEVRQAASYYKRGHITKFEATRRMTLAENHFFDCVKRDCMEKESGGPRMKIVGGCSNPKNEGTCAYCMAPFSRCVCHEGDR